MVKISVIVPVYNCEDYLEESIRSILNQTFKDIEVICVDDGSTDDSLSILNKLSDDDSCLKVYTQENQGASVARNNALEKVSGDYIYFFDADDYAVEDCLEKVYSNAVNNDSDIVFFKYDEYNENTFIKHSSIAIEKQFPEADFNNFSFNCQDYRKLAFRGPFAPWFKFYKKAFLDQHEYFEFPANLIHNDIPFHVKTILKASKISFVPESLYHYRNDNPNSISNTRLSKIHDIFSIIDIVEDFLKSEDLFEDFKDEFDFFKTYQIVYQMQGRSNEYFNIAKKELSEVNINNDYFGEGLRFKANSILNSQSIEEYNYKVEIYQSKSKNAKSGDLMAYEFKFSVLMPIYNVEKYLADAIDSLINQSIGFEENVELIIVDDGSPDNSKDIALKYQEQYPDNIKIFSKSNGGQASAFNFGLKHLNGKYISFFDSDDCLSSNTLSEVYDFFEEHFDEIDVVSIPLILFERKTGDHVLNYKFKSTRVIDLIEEPYNPQFSIASSFIKNESLKGFEFDTDLISWYDALMVNKILLSKKKYGVLSSCSYNYRKRFSSTSSTDNYRQKKESFTDTLRRYHINLINYTIEKEGYVPKFIQCALAYPIQWLYSVSDLSDFLTKDEINEFWETAYEVLSYVDEDVIMNPRIIKKEMVRSYLMYIKNRKDFHIDVVDDQSEIFLMSRDSIIGNLHNNRFYIDRIESDNGNLRLLGTFTSLCDYNALSIEAIKTLSDGTKQVFKEESNDLSTDNLNITRILGIDWKFKHYFDLRIPMEKDEESKIELQIVYNENEKNIAMKNAITFRETSPLDGIINYFVNESNIISFNENSFNVYPYSYEKAYELKHDLFLYIQEILQSEKNLKKENKSLNRKNNSLNKKNNSLNKKNQSLNKKNESLNRKNEKLKAQLKKSKDKNEEILNSTSWKITKPVRMPKQFIKKMKEQ